MKRPKQIYFVGLSDPDLRSTVRCVSKANVHAQKRITLFNTPRDPLTYCEYNATDPDKKPDPVNK